MRDRLPYDYERCAASRCDVRDLCLRYTAECREPCRMGDPSMFGPAVTRIDACSSFIANSKAKGGK